MLDGQAERPVVRPAAPAADEGRIEAADERLLPQALVVHPRAFAVCRRVVQIAIGHEVPVRVVPRACRGHGRTNQRVHVDIVVARRDGFQILADVESDRRLPVSEQVVGHAHPWRDVLPVVPGGRTARIEDFHRGVREGRAADALVGIVRAQGVVPHAALQRQPVVGPLILREEVDRDEIADVRRVDRPHRDGLRELVRHARTRPDLDDLGEVLVGLGRIAEPALIAELHTVGAGDERQRRVRARQRPDQRLRESTLPGRSRHPREQARDAVSPGGATGLADLLQPLDHRRVERAVVAKMETVPRLIRAPAGLGEQLTRDRRLPTGVGLTGRDVEHSVRRFRRRRGGASARTVICVVELLGPVEIELVARRRLPRQPDCRLAFQAVGERLLGFIEVHHPAIRVAGVLVIEHARHGPLPADLAEDVIEPQLVTDNPAAVHPAHVVHVEELERCPEARIFERLGVVAALHRAVRTTVVKLAVEAVRPLSRDGVEDDAARLGFGEPARNGHHHFLRGGHLRHTPAAAARAGPAHVDAVCIDPRIVPAPAVDRGGPPLHRPEDAAGIPVRVHAGNDRLDADNVSRRGNGRENVLADDRLLARALHVDDRRLAADRDRFRECADLQVGVHGRHEIPRQLDAFALDGGEARQRHRHRVGASPQVDDAVLAGGVGDDRPGLFNQCRAGGFHRDARQDRARGVLDDAGDRGLCISRRRYEQRHPHH